MCCNPGSGRFRLVLLLACCGLCACQSRWAVQMAATGEEQLQGPAVVPPVTLVQDCDPDPALPDVRAVLLEALAGYGIESGQNGTTLGWCWVAYQPYRPGELFSVGPGGEDILPDPGAEAGAEDSGWRLRIEAREPLSGDVLWQARSLRSLYPSMTQKERETLTADLAARLAQRLKTVTPR